MSPAYDPLVLIRASHVNPPSVHVGEASGRWREIKQRGAGKGGVRRYKQVLQRLPRQHTNDEHLGELFVWDEEG